MTDANDTSSAKPDVETKPTITDQPIRENLVSTAVFFLENPRVQKSPISQKTAFLKKKGLTDNEIKVALSRADAAIHLPQQSAIVQNSNFVPIPLPLRPRSVWYHIYSVGSSFIVIGIALYGALHFYKLYIEPWLFGDKAETNRITLMEQQLLEMNRSLTELKQTVAELHDLLKSQKEQVIRMSQNEVDYFQNPLVMNDLKAEVGSIKSLLLNRHQFPGVPKVSPSIPIWQMPKSSEENVSEKDTDNTSESVSISENTESASVIITNGDASEKVTLNGTGDSADDNNDDIIVTETTEVITTS